MCPESPETLFSYAISSYCSNTLMSQHLLLTEDFLSVGDQRTLKQHFSKPIPSQQTS